MRSTEAGRSQEVHQDGLNQLNDLGGKKVETEATLHLIEGKYEKIAITVGWNTHKGNALRLEKNATDARKKETAKDKGVSNK